jgi:hypothetical protein
MLYAPSSHERLTERHWDEDSARAAIDEIVAETEGAFDEAELWPAHPRDLEDGPLPAVSSLYLGASGVIWALHELERAGLVDLRCEWAPVAVGLVEHYRAQPDFQDVSEGTSPSLLMGEAGILLVAHTLAPAPWQEASLLEAVRANVANPFWELMWGSPGTMIAAQVMAARTGDASWREAWEVSATRLLAEWRGDLWQQDLYGKPAHCLGPPHGFAGNVMALAGGGLLDAERRGQVERRAIATLEKYAQHEDGLCQWPPTLEPPGSPQPIRTQWCHGAPGMVASLATLAPNDERLTELLVGGGELTWRAGPIQKGAQLCHGTAGNGYAFLKLFERTGNELWLERARGFAMHSIEQVAAARAEHGRGRHTLWTGDLGTALYLRSCLAGSAPFPTIDYF